MNQPKQRPVSCVAMVAAVAIAGLQAAHADPPLFQNSVFRTGVCAVDFALGDFNDDGYPDLAVANCRAPDDGDFDATDTLAVFLNNGAGGFGAPAIHPAGERLVSVEAMDLNGDGSLDLVALDDSQPSLVVMLNQGNGTFDAPRITQLPSGVLTGLAAGDFDDDGHIDIAVASGGSDEVYTLRNAGDGEFVLNETFEFAGDVSEIIAGDYDGDGIDDLIVSEFNGYVFYLFIGGSAQLDSAIEIHTGSGFARMASADYENDGDLDIIATHGNNGPMVLLNAGDGTFTHGPVPSGIIYQSDSIYIVDLDGDEYPDVIYDSLNSSNGASVHRNAGAANRARAETLQITRAIRCLEAADIDADGEIDIITINHLGSVVITRPERRGVFDTPLYRRLPLLSVSLEVSDLDGDELPEVLFSRYSFGFLLNDGHGVFSDAVGSPLTAEGGVFAHADLDGDGDQDIVSADESGIIVHEHLQRGRFALMPTIDFDEEIKSIAIANLDGGPPDLLFRDDETGVVYMALGDGAFGFTPPIPVFGDIHLIEYGVAELTGDAFDDILIRISNIAVGEREILLLTSNGNGSLSSPHSVAFGEFGRFILHDLDADRDIDIVVMDNDSKADRVFVNDGLGGFSEAPDAELPIVAKAIADLNGDALPDLIGIENVRVQISFGLAPFKFAEPVEFSSISGTLSLAVADTDADGDKDLVIHSPDSFSVLRNRTTHPCSRADLNGDGIHDLDDIVTFITLFLDGHPRGDTDGDGFYEMEDILLFASIFSSECP